MASESDVLSPRNCIIALLREGLRLRTYALRRLASLGCSYLQALCNLPIVSSRQHSCPTMSVRRRQDLSEKLRNFDEKNARSAHGFCPTHLQLNDLRPDLILAWPEVDVNLNLKSTIVFQIRATPSHVLCAFSKWLALLIKVSGHGRCSSISTVCTRWPSPMSCKRAPC